MTQVSLEQELVAALNSGASDSFMKEQSYDYQSIFLAKILPDESNPRFFPAVIISDGHASDLISRRLSKKQLSKMYDAENKVLIGKSCIVNCCKYESTEWRKSNKSIASILELAENIAVSEVIQAPTIYPASNDTYKVLTGHRRFFAMVYANGINTAAHFKVYRSKPVLEKTKQFQENASREDLPQYGKLRAFEDAMLEISVLNETKKKLGQKTLTVKETANTLGISMGAFDNYNVLCRYNAVIRAYENGASMSFVKMKKTILSTEKSVAGDKKPMGIETKRKINKKLESLLKDTLGDKSKSESLDARKSKKKRYKIQRLESKSALKVLLTKDLTKMNTGVEWDKLDWDNSIELQNALEQIIEYLNNTTC